MYNIDDIKKDAAWCLNCKNRPCVLEGCPMDTNIPEFIAEVKNDNYKEAYDILRKNNIFSHVCSIVCPQEEQCEGDCTRGKMMNPVNIGKLEKFVNEWAGEKGYVYKPEIKESNGKKVALIGAGPSSLECAYELLKEGFSVTIFEKENVAGGILTYGIPDFRLDKKLVKEVISQIEMMGAEFVFGKELGKDIFINELSKEYDAVFVGIGAEKSSMYALSEEKDLRIFNSDEFLKAYNNDEYIKDLNTVIVIGGGNVAMDSARAALRMNARKVKILYRRDRSHMPAREIELKDAIEDGVEFVELTRVISANVYNGKIDAVKCIKTEIVDGKAVDKEGTEFDEYATDIVFAIGLKPNKELLEKEGIALDDWNLVNVDINGKTNLENVFAGGDIVDNKATVCRAVSAGRLAARGIIKYLENK